MFHIEIPCLGNLDMYMIVAPSGVHTKYSIVFIEFLSRMVWEEIG